MAATDSEVEQRKQIPKIVKFLFGGTSGMAATLFVQPLDLLKNRMQLAGRGTGERIGFLTTAANVVRNEGITGIYSGLSAGLLRQATYTTTRLGVYNSLYEMAVQGGENPNFFKKAAIGMTAGAVGATVGTPAEVALIRMSADGSLPPAERRGYTSVFNAISRIASEEGVLALWKGCQPTVFRAMVVNAAQLATYSQAKQMFKAAWFGAALAPISWGIVCDLRSRTRFCAAVELRDGVVLHFYSSMVSGLATTIASMPVDIVKTRIQNMRTINGVPEYTGQMHVIRSIVQHEGVLAFWKGFWPYYSRLGPHTVLTFIFLEQLRNLYQVYG